MGMIMDNISSPLYRRLCHLITPVFTSADKSLLVLSNKYKVLHLLRCLVVSIFLILLHLVHSLPFTSKVIKRRDHEHLVSSRSSNTAAGQDGDTAIARAIYQLLSLVNSIPTCSRKYELVCSLAEKLIDDNLKEGSETLRQINCVVLSEAFGKTLSQLEVALSDQASILGLGLGGFGLGPVMRAAAKGLYWGKEGDGPAVEKMAAELLWLAHKMEESGGGELVLEKWGWARNLGWLALAAEPSVQASLVKLTAFLIKHAKDMGKRRRTKGGETDQQKQTKMNMLMTWLPLLCRANNGPDAPTLSTSERGEIERSLEDMIDTIEEAENQEKVLSLWIHHFAQSSSSDWPNLYGSYISWCNVSRKLLLATG